MALSPRSTAALLPLGVVLVLAIAFRIPPLINAGAINSDAAIVGLQGRHMLHGEWAWHLWGTDYQGALDSLLSALFFAIGGATPFMLMAMPVVGLLVMVALSFDILRRRVGPWGAALSVMPLVFAPMASNSPMIYVMRQSLATTLVLGIWLADRVPEAATEESASRWWRRRRPRLVLAGLALVVALYIDMFAMVVLPAAIVFMLICALGEEWFERIAFGRLARWGAVGGFVFVAVALASGIVPISRIGRNLQLLASTCLPFALGTKIFIRRELELVAQPWNAPTPLFLIQILGAIVFSLSILSAGVVFAKAEKKKIPWEVRRLGLFGLLTTLATIAAFLVSTKPVDMWSSRYLAPIFWMSPFSFAPLIYRLGVRRLAALHFPYWITALIGGWLSYGQYVDGAWPRVDARAAIVEERALHHALLEAGVHNAESQYWLAYRLTFLFAEDPIVVPLERGSDRYPPYRAKVDEAKTRALIFHPSEPRAQPEPYEAELRASAIRFERREVAGFTVLFVHREDP